MLARADELTETEGIHAIPDLLPGWRADLIQLGRGRVRANGVRLDLSSGSLGLLRIARKSILRAMTPADEYTLLAVPGGEPSAYASTREIRDDQVFAAGAAAGIEVLLPEHASLLFVHFRSGRRRPQSDAAQVLSGGACGILTLSAEHSGLLTECARLLAGLSRSKVRAADVPRTRARLEELIASRMTQCFTEAPLEPFTRMSTTIRRIAVARACEHIDAHVGRPLSLQDLCTAADVGTRTLEYGFREAYGLGPMAYLRSLRLNRVQRDLSAPRGAAESVTEVARRWCFSHMGQFSMDYRNQFGESPSVTLRRNRRSSGWTGDKTMCEGGSPA